MRHNHTKHRLYTVAISVVLVTVAVISTIALLDRHQTEPTQPAKLAQKIPGTPQFSFDAATAPDWRKGPADKVSMAAFYKPSDCFVSVLYKPGTVDEAAMHQKRLDDFSKEGIEATVQAIDTVSMKINNDQKQYQLHQYTVAGGGDNQLYAAQEYGYVQLAGGFIRVEGYCDKTDNLSATIPALQAITFTAAD